MVTIILIIPSVLILTTPRIIQQDPLNYVYIGTRKVLYSASTKVTYSTRRS